MSGSAIRTGAAPALLAAVAFAAAPIAAAAPVRHWVSLCSAEGARLVLLGDGEGIPGQEQDDRGHGGCHAACPRETKSCGKALARL